MTPAGAPGIPPTLSVSATGETRAVLVASPAHRQTGRTDERSEGIAVLGLFTRIKDPVAGTAQVVSGTQPPDSATSANVRLQLVVQAEGIPPYSTELHCIAPTKKWPFPGETLPVVVSRSDPHKLKIVWDDVVPHADRGRAQAEQLAAAMRGDGAAGGGIDPALAGVPPEAQAIVEQIRQAFPGAQVQVGDASALGAAGGMPGQAGEDPEDEMLGRLERLAALHERGVLTDAEFAEQKRRILEDG